MENTAPVQSVRKALNVLDLVIEADVSGEAAPLAVLAGRMAMPRNSVHNLLKTLVACGYVEQQGRGLYVPGSKCRQMVRLSRFDGAAARERVARRLRRFVDAEHEACLLAVLANGRRVVVRYVDCHQAVRVSQTTIEETSFYEKPTGRMLAAVADEAELRQILDRHGLPGPQWDGIDDEPALREALAALRTQGWCRIVHPDEVVALACPVAGEDGAAWAVVGTFAPGYRCPAAREKQLLEALRRLAGDLAAAAAAPGASDAV
ncbi:MAG: helix-turn-helix domain-containing protein [Planctomycetes bacterium]|nr:helix-turn-helix domain-containing protein [Planctomycetota bacterium]